MTHIDRCLLRDWNNDQLIKKSPSFTEEIHSSCFQSNKILGTIYSHISIVFKNKMKAMDAHEALIVRC